MRSIAVNDKLAIRSVGEGSFTLELMINGRLNLMPLNENEASKLKQFLASNSVRKEERVSGDGWTFWSE